MAHKLIIDETSEIEEIDISFQDKSIKIKISNYARSEQRQKDKIIAEQFAKKTSSNFKKIHKNIFNSQTERDTSYKPIDLSKDKIHLIPNPYKKKRGCVL